MNSVARIIHTYVEARKSNFTRTRAVGSKIYIYVWLSIAVPSDDACSDDVYIFSGIIYRCSRFSTYTRFKYAFFGRKIFTSIPSRPVTRSVYLCTIMCVCGTILLSSYGAFASAPTFTPKPKNHSRAGARQLIFYPLYNADVFLYTARNFHDSLYALFPFRAQACATGSSCGRFISTGNTTHARKTHHTTRTRYIHHSQTSNKTKAQ